jgi:hypothetical protein
MGEPNVLVLSDFCFLALMPEFEIFFRVRRATTHLSKYKLGFCNQELARIRIDCSHLVVEMIQPDVDGIQTASDLRSAPLTCARRLRRRAQEER